MAYYVAFGNDFHNEVPGVIPHLVSSLPQTSEEDVYLHNTNREHLFVRMVQSDDWNKLHAAVQLAISLGQSGH